MVVKDYIFSFICVIIELSATSGNSNRNSNQQPHSATSDETTTSYCRRTHSPPLISELDTNRYRGTLPVHQFIFVAVAVVGVEEGG